MSQIVNAKSDRVFREDTLEEYHHDVERAIEVMYARFGESLSVGDLADAAFLSRFHFSRVFARITGVSPARFLAAIRAQEAKRLLLKSDRSITDICFDVGYNSHGTFTRIFASFVGFSPIVFRQFSKVLKNLTPYELMQFAPSQPSSKDAITISGEIVCEKPLALVVVALFPTAIPRSHPIECICLTNSRQFAFSKKAPDGARIFAAGMSPSATIEDALVLNESHVSVGSGAGSPAQNSLKYLHLKPKNLFAPPLVLAFPLLLAKSYMASQSSRESPNSGL